MAPLADLIASYAPFTLPYHLTHYVKGETPLSTTPVVVSTLAGYLALIFSIQALMKDRQPMKLQYLFQAHNVFLSSGSLLVLFLMLEEIIPVGFKLGPFGMLCGEKAWTGRMETFYMINYMFKYVELIDTVFLALKKKPLQFLHVFHHSATALLCYNQLDGKTSISWTVITLNLAVHVLMYYYYFATAGGARIWWKKYLTLMQITQFVIDLFLVYFGTYQHFAFTYYRDSVPNMGNCAGSEDAAIFGCVLLTSYLGLFINFYFSTYKKPAPKSKVNGTANGKVNGDSKKP